MKNESKKAADEVTTRTGFRKTRFGDGKIWLNDRVLQMKGYAQRTSNEWPQIVEVVEPAAGELDLFKAKNGDKHGNELRIVEVNFLENMGV